MPSIEFIDALTSAEGSRRAVELFSKSFGAEPVGVWSAPGRVNLIGEHTDYNAGLCLPIALPHRTFIALRPRADSLARVVSEVNPEAVTEVDLGGLQSGQVEGWAAYPVGVAWALRDEGYKVGGFDAAFVSCVPLGAGLSSSAAMTCSTALGLDDIFGLGFGHMDAGRVTLVDVAIRAENEMAGAATGGMDQNASMRCEAGYALLLDCRPELSALENVSQRPCDLAAYGLELLVVDTQAPHQLNDGQYENRRSACQQAAEFLGVRNLRELTEKIESSSAPHDALEAALELLPTKEMRKRVHHVVTEIIRVKEFVFAFGRGDIAAAGRLLNASHDSLRDDYEVTVPQLDIAVDVARQAGAKGARMTGGGFGGSIIALVDAGTSHAIAQKIADEFAAQGFDAPRALIAIPSAAASRVC
jgi:galactokinase